MSNFIYFIRPIGAEGPIKIGHSFDVPGRLKQCAAYSPVALEIVATLPVNDAGPARMRRSAVHLERRFHLKYSDYLLHAEWFTPHDELLSDIAAIQSGSFDLDSLPPFVVSNLVRAA